MFNICTGKYENSPITVSRQVMPKGFVGVPNGHYHESYELFYVIHGYINAFIDNKTYHVSDGCMVILNSLIPHAHIYPQDIEVERICISFDREFTARMASFTEDINILEAFHSGINVISCPVSLRKFIEDTVDKMLTETNNGKQGSASVVASLLMHLLIVINRNFRNLELHQQVLNTPAYARTAGIIEYIRSNYTDDISLDSISEKFNISRYYIIKLFKRYTGFTPIEYVNNVRVLKAIELLTSKERKTVNDIGELVGFNSITHFGRVFKKVTGVSPQKYRTVNSHKFRVPSVPGNDAGTECRQCSTSRC
ncbi:MAG: AraC family transcriptional regulator [bacterium]|nr:AraC family transcriptional regulator [bacterium]